MNRKNTGFPDDRTERQRRKGLNDEQIKELERAGGVEGGMQAGSAGGPNGSALPAKPELSSDKAPSRADQSERRSSR
jgi:hypothetical protein